MKKLKTILKEQKQKIIVGGVVLLTACAGGFLGARLGIENAFHRTKFEINVLAPDGEN